MIPFILIFTLVFADDNVTETNLQVSVNETINTTETPIKTTEVPVESILAETFATESTNVIEPTLPPTESITATPLPSSEPTSTYFSTPTPKTPTPQKSLIERVIEKWNIPDSKDQIILVVANGTSAEVSMYRKNNTWEKIMSCPGYTGSNGVGTASEGSRYSPKGVFSLSSAFGHTDNPGTILPYTKINDSHYWVDDPVSQYYNKFVSTNDVVKDWSSAEHLIEYPKAYKYSVVIDYNTECVPGAGSAFFLHCDLGFPTYGCIAISESQMLFVLKNISSNAVIVIINQSDL